MSVVMERIVPSMARGYPTELRHLKGWEEGGKGMARSLSLLSFLRP